MSRIIGKDTGLGMRVQSALHRRESRFRKYVKELPGRPDIFSSKTQVGVFVNGDFWHGIDFLLGWLTYCYGV